MSGRDPDRRRALLDAADRVIQSGGPEVSMAAIAAEAGITKPILYRHFGDKSGLYQALADRHVHTVIAQLRPKIAEAEADLRARARAAIGVYLDLVSANVNLYRFLVHRASAEDSRIRSHMTSLVRGLGEELGGVLATERAVPDPVRAQVLGHAFVGMVQTTGDWWLDHPEVDRAQVVEGLVDVIAAALSPRDAGGRPAPASS
ncbi:TetR/AcrR family transcriptional regulator [Nonomuraea jiangxiensis]|uniref:DNA-binding transcriptional regulator, AcrR family n=1 Tax=Nonomuraea jiangxiensis TaxID=633440 RepID=A0A1G8K3Q2_9ACTN|nr:TetR/AcrR family transcriptional regulator [Nonomuraea jiangxiensis]SDI38072.1 DNA-binding transcriptional regulator, AcrR family [Nonomuraea jiangxiensis]